MESTVVKIIEKYLEFQKKKEQKGYSDELRLLYDDDAKFYLKKGYPKEIALHADTIISFWTIYSHLLEIEAGWKTYKTSTKSLESLLYQIRSKRRNDYTSNIIKVNDSLEDFAKVVYSEGNYMLLPLGKRKMNNERYERFEDRIDMTLFHLFAEGELSHYFANDNEIVTWIRKEKLDILFVDCDIRRESIIWLVENNKKITDMDSSEIYAYIDSAISFIKKRSM